MLLDWIFIAGAGLLLALAILAESRRRGALFFVNASAVAVASGFIGDAVYDLGHQGLDRPLQGLVLLLAGGVYATVAAVTFGRLRNLTSLLEVASFIFVASACALIFSGEAFVVALALLGTLILVMADLLGEPRFQLAAVAVMVAAAIEAAIAAPPDHLLRANSHPAAGVAGVAAVTLAFFTLARLARFDAADDGDMFDALLASVQWRLRDAATWTAAFSGAYGTCLVALGVGRLSAGHDLDPFKRELILSVTGLVLIGGYLVWKRIGRRPEPTLDDGRFVV
jgi:hypothetical protein